MGISIGLLELKSIPPGVETADDMLKAANVQLILASPVCPGKYVIIISGQVGAVKNAMAAGLQKAGSFLVAEHIINNIHETVPPAISGTAETGQIKSIGVVESISALTVVRAGDIAAKASNVRLLDIRIARGLGGKGFVIFSGEISSVKSALQSCLNELQESGEITSSCVIASPHPDLIEKLLN